MLVLLVARIVDSLVEVVAAIVVWSLTSCSSALPTLPTDTWAGR
jgi:hypothetical protein